MLELHSKLRRRTLESDIESISKLGGVQINLVDDGFLNIIHLSEDGEDDVFFENSSDVNEDKNNGACRFEIVIRLKGCIYAVQSKRDTIITLSVDVPHDYPQASATIEVLYISNSLSKLKKKCELYFTRTAAACDSGDDSYKGLYQIIEGFYNFLHDEVSSVQHYANFFGLSGSLPLREKTNTSSFSNTFSKSLSNSTTNFFETPSHRSYGAAYRSTPSRIGVVNQKEADRLHNFFVVNSRYYRDFEQEKVLGSGSFGCVTKVKHNGVSYAVKQIPIYRSYGTSLHEEAAILASLQHRNIVRYYDAWLEKSFDSIYEKNKFGCCHGRTASSIQLGFVKGTNSTSSQTKVHVSSLNCEGKCSFKVISQKKRKRIIFREKPRNTYSQGKRKVASPHEYLFILMEYCAGETLLETICRQKLYESPQRIIELFRQILEALSYIHEKGIIHRDIKPSNIFLKSDGELLAKLGDFGLTAKLTHQSANSPRSGSMHPTGMVGTLHYMAPEQIRGDVYDEKVDIYSAGVVLFEMSCPPFKTSMERSEILSSFSTTHKRWPEGFREKIDNRLFKILEAMLSIDPGKRPSATCLLQSELFSSSQFDTEFFYRVITQYPYSMESAQLLNTLFERKEPVEKSVDYFARTIADTSATNHVNIELYRLYKQEFKARGALRCEVPLFVESPTATVVDIGESNDSKGCTLLLTDGRICQLRYSLLPALAECIPSSILVIMRRWYWGKVYRSDVIGSRYPRELWHCAYDIVIDYGIILQESELNPMFLDAFFTAELVSVITRPLLKFMECTLVVEWGCKNFVLNVLKYGFGLPTSVALDVEAILLEGIRTNNPFILKQKFVDACRIFLSNATSGNTSQETLLNALISFSSLLGNSKTKTPGEFVNALYKIIISTNSDDINKAQKEIDKILYMDSFFTNKDRIGYFFSPHCASNAYCKADIDKDESGDVFDEFMFAINIKIGKREFVGVSLGGRYGPQFQSAQKTKITVSDAYNSLNRASFGVEINLQPIFDLFNQRESVLLSGSLGGSLQFGCYLTPQVLICISHMDFLMNAVTLEHEVQRSGITCDKQLGHPGNIKKLRKMKECGLTRLQKLEIIISLKLSTGNVANGIANSNTIGATQTITTTNANRLSGAVQYRLVNLDNNFELTSLDPKQVIDYICTNIRTR